MFEIPCGSMGRVNGRGRTETFENGQSGDDPRAFLGQVGQVSCMACRSMIFASISSKCLFVISFTSALARVSSS